MQLKLARGKFHGGIRDWPSLNEQNLMCTQAGPGGINSQSRTTPVRNVFDSYLCSFGSWLNGKYFSYCFNSINAGVFLKLNEACDSENYF